MPITEVKFEDALVVSPIADAFAGRFFLVEYEGEQHRIYINRKGDPQEEAKVEGLLDKRVTVWFVPLEWAVKDKRGVKKYLVKFENVS